MWGMSRENDENEIHRSEGEGMVFHHEYREIEERDPELDAFLTSVVETFEGDPEILELRAAIIVRVANMKKEERIKMVGVARKHLMGERPVGQEPTVQNIRSFLVKEGGDALMTQIEHFLPKERWENLQRIAAARFERFKTEYKIEEQYLAGTPG